jgi:hypothetical protein
MPRRRFSTSTISGDEFVPWLASAGELAYSPYQPPENDYFFQYSWIIPGVFRAGVNLRQHFWFGDQFRDRPDVRLLFSFWNKARSGEVTELFLSNGTAGPLEHLDVTAPLAVYLTSGLHSSDADRLILIQHGSYLFVDVNSQPYIERGHAVLYRGIQKARIFNLHRLIRADVRLRLMRVHARTLADSVTSFNTVHCNVSRSETWYLNDRSYLLDTLCAAEGLKPERRLNSAIYSGYAMEEWAGVRKFGANYIKFRTPLTNLRITTFVCNETEVKVIDPNKLEVVETVGCRVREVSL